MTEIAHRPAACRAIPQIGARHISSAIRAGSPFVVRNHPSMRPLAKVMNLPDLARRLSGRKIEVEHKHRWVASCQELDAADYLSNITDTEYYWRHFSLRSFGLRASLPKPALRRSVYFDYGWIGPADTVQTFHQDNHDEIFVNHNLFAQVIGHKYVAVASPIDSDFFQGAPLTPGDRRHSRASPWDQSTRQACSSLLETTLEAGDILYIPPRYWHFMKSNSTSLSISRWWFDTRIAELIYAAAAGVNVRRPSGSTKNDWANDLAQFGGDETLNELLKRKPAVIQLRILLALTRFYGKGILNVRL